MTRTLMTYMMALIAIALGACSVDTPTQVREESDAVVAQLVAGTLGYETGGLSATLGDLATVQGGDSIRTSDASHVVPVSRVTYSDSVFDAGSHSRIITVARQREIGGVAIGDRNRYTIYPAPADRPGRFADVVEADGDGSFSNSFLSLEGESKGRFGVRATGRYQASLYGNTRFAGATTFASATKEGYGDVTIDYSWEGLQVTALPNDDYRRILGRIDVSVEASGPRGIISRAGVVTFDGSRNAVLEIGDNRFVIDLKSGELRK